MDFAQTMQEDRRGVILCLLDEAGGLRLPEGSLKTALGSFGHRVSTDEVRGDVGWLEKQALVRLEKKPLPGGGDLWIVQMLEAGQDVAHGSRHPGVKQQAPKR